MQLEDKGRDNFHNYVKLLKRLIVNQNIHFDLIVGAGDSGMSMSKIAELVYIELGLVIPKLLTIPYYRFTKKNVSSGNEYLNPNTYLSKVINTIQGISSIKHVLFVDDEIGQGNTVFGTIKILEKVLPDTKYVDLYILAEDHGFDPKVLKTEIKIFFKPFSNSQKDIYNAISYIIPYEIEKYITEKYSDETIGSKVRMNSLFGLPSKEMVKSVPVWSYSIYNKLQKEIPNFSHLRIDFEKYIISLIRKAVQ
ncbi:phosphoribosyltransferase [Candidatus Woesebacteria bacterium]|nr:MAG: phosphoribosyltransferase [Candidatus Woesebacteria bacterium]